MEKITKFSQKNPLENGWEYRNFQVKFFKLMHRFDKYDKNPRLFSCLDAVTSKFHPEEYIVKNNMYSLTLEQHRFEPQKLTYKWIFFNSTYFSTTWSMVGWIWGGQTVNTEKPRI